MSMTRSDQGGCCAPPGPEGSVGFWWSTAYLQYMAAPHIAGFPLKWLYRQPANILVRNHIDPQTH